MHTWRNFSQKHRWMATALLEIEIGLRKVKGYKKHWKLREALRRIKSSQGNGASHRATSTF